MQKKILYSAVLAVLAGAQLLAGENLLPEDLYKYRRSNATVKSDGFLYDVKPGKWNNISVQVPLKKGFYRFSFEYKSSGKVSTGTVLKAVLQPENPKGKYRRQYNVKEFSGAWEKLSGYLCMPTDGNASLNVYIECKLPIEVAIRKLRLEPFMAEQLSTIKLESEKGLAVPWEPQVKFRNSASRMELVPAEDHIEGGYALRILPEKGVRTAVAGIAVPAMENSDYRVSAWLKSDTEMPVILTADGWVPGEKHWYKKQKFRVTGEWQRFSFDFKTPELSCYGGMLRIQVTPCADYNSLQIKDAMLEKRSK